MSNKQNLQSRAKNEETIQAVESSAIRLLTNNPAPWPSCDDPDTPHYMYVAGAGTVYTWGPEDSFRSAMLLLGAPLFTLSFFTSAVLPPPFCFAAFCRDRLRGLFFHHHLWIN